MDPISVITAALIAGATKSLGEVAGKAITDAYSGLKEAIHRRFGGGSEVAKAVQALEDKPDSEGRKQTLKEEVAASGAGQDPEILKLAEQLTELIKAQPGGEQYFQQASGTGIAQAAGGITATVTMGQPNTVNPSDTPGQ